MVNYKRDDDEVFSGINIVPFTDIVLVLLIIFMIAAPGLVTSGFNLELPGAKSSNTSPTADVRITLDSRGILYFQNQEIQFEALEKKTLQLVQENKDRGIMVNADISTKHGKVIKLLDMLRGQGARRIYVGTIQK